MPDPLPYINELSTALNTGAEVLAFACAERRINFYAKRTPKISKEDITDYFQNRFRFGMVHNTNDFGSLTGLRWVQYDQIKLSYLVPLDGKDRRIDYLKWRLVKKVCAKRTMKYIHFKHLTENNKPVILTKPEMYDLCRKSHKKELTDITPENFLNALKKA